MKDNIFNINSGLMIPKTSDGRIIFILPYQDHFLIGKINKLLEEQLIKYMTNLNIFIQMRKKLHI